MWRNVMQCNVRMYSDVCIVMCTCVNISRYMHVYIYICMCMYIYVCVLIIILHGFVGRTFFQHIGAWKQHGLRSGRSQVEMQPPSKSCQMWNSSSREKPMTCQRHPTAIGSFVSLILHANSELAQHLVGHAGVPFKLHGKLVEDVNDTV